MARRHHPRWQPKLARLPKGRKKRNIRLKAVLEFITIVPETGEVTMISSRIKNSVHQGEVYVKDRAMDGNVGAYHGGDGHRRAEL
jgi:hypothetical protein